MRQSKSKWRRLGAVLAVGTALVSASLIMADSAMAGPDKGKIVATLGHVDSPHAFWEKDNFVLRSHAGETPYPLIEDTVNWIGKGWKGAEATYNYVVPSLETADFLGESGTVLYRAPAVPDMNTLAPIWLGMGADRNIPIDEFRDKQFVLDLIDLKGPGRLEMFNRNENNFNRFISSHDNSVRSYWMTAGSHTHNETTFTKPGRYEVTYRISARKKDGSLVQSKPQVLAYQVGGNNPKDDSIGDYQEAYVKAKASNDAEAGKPRITLKPLENFTKPGDEYLTSLNFTTGNKADSGIVVWTIDGFYLTEAKVEKGVSEYAELLGDKSSRIQAMYIPNNGPTARWISETINYKRFDNNAKKSDSGGKITNQTISTEKADTALAAPASDDPTPDFPKHIGNISDPKVSLALTPMKDGRTKIVATAAKEYYGVVKGGFYERSAPDAAGCSFELSFGGKTKSETEDDFSYCTTDNAGKEIWDLRTVFLTHPELETGSAKLEVKNFDVNKESVVAGELGGKAEPSPVPSTVAPSPAPTPAPKPELPENTGPCSIEKPCIFSSGHVDIFHLSAPKSDGKPTLKLDLKEDVTGSEIKRAPETVLLKVKKAAYTKATSAYKNLGSEPTYTLPMTQNPDLLWPGWDTLQVRESGIGKTSIHLAEITGPQGGKVYAYRQAGSFGNEMESVTTAKDRWELRSGDEIIVPNPAHAHLYWSFNKPGKYQMKVYATAPVPSGVSSRSAEPAVAAAEELRSNTVTYTWIVGDYEVPTPAPNPDKPTPAPNPDKPTPAPNPDKPTPAPNPDKPTPAPDSDSSNQPETAIARKIPVTGTSDLGLFGVVFGIMLIGGVLLVSHRKL